MAERSDPKWLEDRLVEELGIVVRVRNIRRDEGDEERLIVCDLEFPAHTEATHARGRIRNTAVVFMSPAIKVPLFTAGPETTLVMRVTKRFFGELGDIDFDDSPEFSQQYHLFGWSEESVRALFTRPVRDRLAESPGWTIRGKGNLLVLYRWNKTVPDEELPQFLREALRVLEPLKESAAALAERPDIVVEPTPNELARAADSIGGIAGTMLLGQLRRLLVPRRELEEYLSAEPPREIPRGVRAQVLGQSAGFYIGGGIALLSGTVFCVVGLLEPGNPPPQVKLLFPIVGAIVALIGLGLIVAGAIYRRRRLRILRNGRLLEGRIEKMERSSIAVNQQPMFYVRIRYEVDGEERTAELRALGPQANSARRLHEEQRPVRLLV
ncbi:MAG: hypothetical protein D6725_09220, partial [Planctomycetota bacterium]